MLFSVTFQNGVQDVLEAPTFEAVCRLVPNAPVTAIVLLPPHECLGFGTHTSHVLGRLLLSMGDVPINPTIGTRKVYFDGIRLSLQNSVLQMPLSY